MGGNLDIYRNAAFLTLDADDCYGTVHPRDAQISESVLIVCSEIQRQLAEGKLKLQEDESIVMTMQALSGIIINCRNKWKNAWSKEYCEMDEDRLGETVENPILRKTAKEVRKKKRAGYQENILKDLLEDMELERPSRKQ